MRRGLLLLFLVVPGLLAACTYDPAIPQGVIGCAPGGLQCPAGLKCIYSGSTAGYLCRMPIAEVDDAAPPVDAEDVVVVADAAIPDAGPPEDAAPHPADAAAPDTAPADRPAVDTANPDAGMGVVVGPPCPDTGRGPKMVRVGAYCIDATEVSNQQYQAFVTIKGADLTGQPTVCMGANARFTPEGTTPPWPPPAGRADLPVVNVDWCDAATFCTWAGKRLCGKIGGGTVSTAQALDPNVSQWGNACGRKGSRRFPYGDSFKEGACNVEKLPPPAGDVVAAGSSTGCQGGYDGVFDMIGNVEEWIDSCGLSEDLSGDACAVVGGSFAPSPGQPDCTNSAQMNQRLSTFAARGFRCCSKE
jgi:sulfatase modifying factor 1